MKTILCCIFACLLIAASLSATPIKFIGKPPTGAPSVARFARADTPADSIQAALGRQGYLDASVTRAGDTLVIDAGVQLQLDTTFVRYDSSQDIIVSGAPFSESTIAALTERLLEQEYASGFWYAAIEIDRIERHDRGVNLHLTVRPGPNLTIRQIDLHGLLRTRPDLISEYLPVISGDTLTLDNVAATERAAERIDFVRFISPATILPQAGYTAADLRLDFEEQRPLTAAAGGGYIPNDTASEFVWHLNLRFNNLFGGGRQARLLSERREEGRQLLQIGYSQPVFLFGAGRFDGEVATRDYRDSFYEFGARVGLTTRFGEQLSGGLELGFRRVEPAEQTPSFSAYRVSFSSGWDRLDNRFNPSAGIRFESSLAYIYRRYDTDSLATASLTTAYNETKALAEAEFYQTLVGRLVGHVGLQYRGLETSEPLPPLSELILVGGPGTLRGYRNEQFVALRTALVTVESRWRFDTGYLFAFYDGAYLNNRVGSAPESVRTDERYRYGYGLGLGLSDQRRSVRLSLGWNPDLSYDQPRLSIELTSDI